MAVKRKIAKNQKNKKIKAATSTKAKPKAKKTTARGAMFKADAASQANFPASPITEKQTKAQIYAEIAEMTGFAKADVKQMFAALKNVLERHIKGRGFGEFVIPELGVKVRRVHKAATKARMGRNPFTGEEIEIPAKPARKSVRATALKALKELVLS